MNFAYVTASEAGAVNRALSALAIQLLSDGLRVIGTTQHDSPRSGSHICDMDVRVLPDGDIIRISQDLGPGSRGCRLDQSSLEAAVAATEARLDKAQLLIVNKFGKHEAEGRGFRSVIAEALSRDIPVIVGTNHLNLSAFRDFCGDQALPLGADLPVLLDWVRATIRDAA